MIDRKGNKKVFDVGGKTIQDKNGDFMAGLIWLRDVTEFKEKLSSEERRNEEQFRVMCDSMPQMVHSFISLCGLCPSWFNNFV
jgi:hypothetical protein